jgi:hypothetical protein
MAVRSIMALSIPLLLMACSDEQSQTGPGGVSTDDAKALDEAAEQLDAEAAGDLPNQPDTSN